DEVVIVSDFARARETPIAFSNVLPAKLEEELAGRDIPMVLNSTPGVYATEQGGGDGDARITIRGFSQNNIATMLDGVPVNDMENGWVYWSNWFGLDVITRTIQVQRGLGASKLGIPSVGGTMNIMTKGIDNKPTGTVKQEITDYGYYRTSFGVSSGRVGNWGFTAAGSYKWGTGWADATDTKGFFYYLKMERRLGNHVISLTGFGAPQEHGQRSYGTSMGLIDSTYAVDVAGAEYTEADNPAFTYRQTSTPSWNSGRRYNSYWGYLNRWSLGASGDTVWNGQETINSATNYYHKPQFSLKDTWTVNDKLFISSTLYLSIGNGGGTGLKGSNPAQTDEGLIDFQAIFNSHRRGIFAIDGPSGLYKGTNILYSNVNNHFWYGLLSSAEYQLNESLSLSGGIDLRSYKAEHYREVYDLLGGDVFIEPMTSNVTYNNQDRNALKGKGDKYYFNNDGLVNWYGTFFQAEYVNPNWSGFVSGSLSNSSYKRVDHFAPYMIGDQVIHLIRDPNDPTALISDIVNVDGVDYYIGHPDVTRPGKETPWENFFGYTVKAGFNYNISERFNAFVNLGNLSKAPRYKNVFAGNRNIIDKKIENEIVYAAEIGSGYTSPKFSANLNTYYTYWNNKPLDNIPRELDNNTERYMYLNITGISARHMGIEFDCVYKPIKQIDIQGLVSLGDWIYTSSDSVNFIDEAGEVVLDSRPIVYDANGVHVGDAAQTQIGGSIRYNFIKDAYIQGRITHFSRQYANFEPSDLVGENEGRESWLTPDYTLFDLSLGYNFTIYEKYKGALNFNVLNVFDTMYISDAQNNDSYGLTAEGNFDARSATVFMGIGRRFNLSLRLFF
ncbi:MAG: TonB-dependent receptor plug domain-containing protein, partial [Salinivirgaceae bacterium]|nr:TonB-dependent receptor plug domain-containing protein [Salinivirgaceae bacterium]